MFSRISIRKAVTAAVIAAMTVSFAACGNKDNNGDNDLDLNGTAAQTSVPEDAETDEDMGTVSVYYGKEVENEEDLAIFKFNAELPDGYKAFKDDSEGKQFVSEIASITVKAQNYKEEFQELAAFADQGCAAIKINNMLYQADTEFSDPMDTTVAGFDAVRYDYTITAYRYLVETDSEGQAVLNDEGKPNVLDEREVDGIYKDRVYYFYSDEDVFYVICESSEENYEKASADFDAFINSISITKK